MRDASSKSFYLYSFQPAALHQQALLQQSSQKARVGWTLFITHSHLSPLRMRTLGDGENFTVPFVLSAAIELITNKFDVKI